MRQQQVASLDCGEFNVEVWADATGKRVLLRTSTQNLIATYDGVDWRVSVVTPKSLRQPTNVKVLRRQVKT